MKVITKKKSLESKSAPVITLGNFDGIHLGHQKILASVIKRAKALGAPSLVYTFDPHPLKIVAPEKSPALIFGLEDKKALIEAAGIDYLVLARFTEELAATAPDEFAEKVIVDRLKAVEVLVGENFSFGRGRSGGIVHLKELGEKLGFVVRAVAPCKRSGSMVSSSRIRACVLEGMVQEAGALLGRPFFIRGKVVTGDSVGRELGFPTANIEAQSELIPGDGVYAAMTTIGGNRFKGMVNIGNCPTFGGKSRKIEIHIMGFNREIYGDNISVEFLKRLRGEKTFLNSDALVRQIKEDRDKVEEILADAEL